MKSITASYVAFGLGTILLLIALIKFSVIGYYPSEALPFGAVGAVGAILMLVGSRLYRAAKVRAFDNHNR